MTAKAVAVIAAGIDEEYQGSVLDGICAAAREAGANLSCFAAFGGVLLNPQYDAGEYNIYRLYDPAAFDGVILLTNTVSDPAVRDEILCRTKQAGIPAVVLDSEDAQVRCNIRIDNAAAMRQITEHVLTVHGAKTVNFISGPLANPEAQTRYAAFRAVCEAHGIQPDPRRIFFGEFRPTDGRRAVTELLRSGLPMPDAVIAANDAMALEAIAALEEHGIRVPEDVIVTGFDNTYYARNHSPALTTVSRPLHEAGAAAFRALMQCMSGADCPETVTLDAAPVFTESCGCPAHGAESAAGFRKSAYELLKRVRGDISLLNRMTSALAVSETPEENIRVLSRFFGEMGCEQCCVCLCEGWENAYRDAAEPAQDDLTAGYTQMMTAPLIWKGGSVSAVSRYPLAALHPDPPAGGGNVSYYLPLHFRERCLGYYIITNGDFPVRSMLCHSVMIGISHSFENIRKLLRLNHAIQELDRLYVTDPLCGIYNRNGFIRLADGIFRSCASTGAPLMISFIDMDGLKLINDNYGHDEGDFALQRLAEAIRESCTDGCICARFGGDEFLMVGAGFTEEEAKRIEQQLADRITGMNSIIGKPYTLSASIGTFVTYIQEGMKLFSLISQADQIMYEQKKKKRTSRYLRKD